MILPEYSYQTILAEIKRRDARLWQIATLTLEIDRVDQRPYDDWSLAEKQQYAKLEAETTQLNNQCTSLTLIAEEHLSDDEIDQLLKGAPISEACWSWYRSRYICGDAFTE